MSAESSLTAVAVVRALLNEDTEGLAVLLPDGLPEAGRELVASLASLAVLSARVAAQAEGIPVGEYLDRIITLWTDRPATLAGAAPGPGRRRPPRRPGELAVTSGGVERVPPPPGAACWICGLTAVCGEKLPGRRHKTRALCQAHADAVFGAHDPGEAKPPDRGDHDAETT